jgi:hypothetical protein
VHGYALNCFGPGLFGELLQDVVVIPGALERGRVALEPPVADDCFDRVGRSRAEELAMTKYRDPDRLARVP